MQCDNDYLAWTAKTEGNDSAKTGCDEQLAVAGLIETLNLVEHNAGGRPS